MTSPHKWLIYDFWEPHHNIVMTLWTEKWKDTPKFRESRSQIDINPTSIRQTYRSCLGQICRFDKNVKQIWSIKSVNLLVAVAGPARSTYISKSQLSPGIWPCRVVFVWPIRSGEQAVNQTNRNGPDGKNGPGFLALTHWGLKKLQSYRRLYMRSFSGKHFVFWLSSRMFVPTVPCDKYRQTSNISSTKSHKFKCFSSRFVVVFAQTIEGRCSVENEDVVGAAPTGDALTTSEWSTILLPTKVWLILEFLRYISLFTIV